MPRRISSFKKTSGTIVTAEALWYILTTLY